MKNINVICKLDILSQRYVEYTVVCILILIHIIIDYIPCYYINNNILLLILISFIIIFFIYYINFIDINFSSKYPVIYTICMVVSICILFIIIVMLIKVFIYNLLWYKNFVSITGYKNNVHDADRRNDYRNKYDNNSEDNTSDNNKQSGGDDGDDGGSGNGNNNGGEEAENINVDTTKKKWKGKGKQIYVDSDQENEKSKNDNEHSGYESNDNNNDEDDNSSWSVYSSIRGDESPYRLEKKIQVLDTEETLKKRKFSEIEEQEEEDIRIAKLRSLDPTHDHSSSRNDRAVSHNYAESSRTAAARNTKEYNTESSDRKKDS